MVKIGLLSDTHGFLDPKISEYFKDCDEIWHAGDIGSVELSDQLSSFRKMRGVFGNIDGQDIRIIHPAEQKFTVAGLKVYMIHIGGYPGNYSPGIISKIKNEKPGLFICGHSHILKVIPDKTNNLLHMNPGAAGKHGFHIKRTILRFEIDSGKIQKLEAIELGLRSAL